MKQVFDMWKKGFDAWENATAQYLENVLQSPSVLRPSGALLTAAMKAKAARDEALAGWWKSFGLPTRQDQERAMHVLNQLTSRIHDLEEQLEDLRETQKD